MNYDGTCDGTSRFTTGSSVCLMANVIEMSQNTSSDWVICSKLTHDECCKLCNRCLLPWCKSVRLNESADPVQTGIRGKWGKTDQRGKTDHRLSGPNQRCYTLEYILATFVLVCPSRAGHMVWLADLCLIPADRNRFRFRSEKLELIPIPIPAEHGHVESIPIPTPDFWLRNRFRFDSIGRGQ